MELVNGIPCFNCTDVERAKKAGINGQGQAGRTPVLSGVIAPPPAREGGLTADAVVPVEGVPTGANQPLSSGDRGTVLNVAV
jgi:hypothetical protein